MEYATRDQAQNAVATLSNQNLMGRLVYVREASHPSATPSLYFANRQQDREAEPRFGPPGGAQGGRGVGFAGPMNNSFGAGGFGAGGGNGGGGAMGNTSGRQIYISNVSSFRLNQN